MKRTYQLRLIALLIVAMAGLFAMGAAPAGPLVIAPATGVQLFGPSMARYSAGEIDIAQPPVWTHRFTLRNTSANTVTITQLKGSCDCTSGRLLIAGHPMASPLTLAPHMDIAVEVDIQTAKLTPGPLDKMLWVFVAGRGWPADTIEMTGTIVAPKPAHG